MTRTLPLAALALATVAAAWLYMSGTNSPTYVPRDLAAQEAGIRGAWDYYRMVRGNVNTGEIELEDIRRVRKGYAAFAEEHSKAVGLQWIEMGPDNIGGRVRSIVVDPNDPNVVWTGGVSGGLWRSGDAANTWQKIDAFSDNIIVSTLAILGNGHVYVGTGSSFDGPSGTGGSGFVGGGLFRSTDNGATFELVAGPTSSWNANSEWVVIDKIVAHPTDPNKLWVAYNRGLRIYDETSDTFTTPPNVPGTTPCRAVEVSVDGTTIVANFGFDGYLSTDGGQSFVLLNASSGFPQSNIGRMEFAISPDDPNYIYSMCATTSGGMLGVWSSTDRGTTWSRIWPGGIGVANGVPALDIFRDNTQGIYDNVMSVRPGAPDEIWLGGVELWKTSLSGQPQQLALPFDFPGCFSCVHVDIHEITWAPDGQTVYVGCDGGVYKSIDAGNIWVAANRDLNITQFYGMGFDPTGKVNGGTQDNGSLYIDLRGNTEKEAVELTGGDGFDSDISQIDTNIMFTTLYFGAVFRTSDGGINFADMLSPRMLTLSSGGNLGAGLGDFYTNIRLYENWNDLGSEDSVEWVNNGTDTLFFGDQIIYRGNVPVIEQQYTVTQSMVLPGDTLMLQDRVQSLFAIGFGANQGVWVTRDALNIAEAAEWWKVIDNLGGGTTTCLEWSADGNTLFVGTSDGRVVRVTGFNEAYTLDEADVELGNAVVLQQSTILNANNTVTGLAPDPSDPARLMVTFGNYGGGSKVRITDNALAANPSFSIIWNVPTDLLGMPVYDGIIHADNGDILVIGTEMGIFSSDDAGQTWTVENDGLAPVPVFAVRQQTWNWQNNPYGPTYVRNPYVIYAATHGRGFFRTETLLGVDPGTPIAGSEDVLDALTFFPNPVVNTGTLVFELKERADVTVTLYDLNGRLVEALPRRVLPSGEQRLDIPVNGLANGTYLVEVRTATVRRMARFVVSR
ncbi:MAG: T9SS type A sorting domain-containing protein [Flavobacteriales bacterium]|nr:T9SS type A sorting domain-containing protein [Flavobacteriales bacterium]